MQRVRGKKRKRELDIGGRDGEGGREVDGIYDSQTNTQRKRQTDGLISLTGFSDRDQSMDKTSGRVRIELQ